MKREAGVGRGAAAAWLVRSLGFALVLGASAPAGAAASRPQEPDDAQAGEAPLDAGDGPQEEAGPPSPAGQGGEVTEGESQEPPEPPRSGSLPELLGSQPPGGAPVGRAPTGEGEVPAEPSRPPLPPQITPAYRSGAETAELCRALAASAPQAARAFELAPADSAPALVGLEFGKPGPVALEARPTLLLLGGLDGVSLSGGEAALAVAARLLAQPERLPEGVAFVVVPWADPAGLASRFRGRREVSAPTRPQIDEDRDGRLDEDAPDDLDGDGLILRMLLEDTAGPWTFSSDARFLVPATAGDGPRYRSVPEGRDDDGDGLYNEDGPGGVVLDRNFPLGRENAWRDPLCGPTPLCDPSARALADLALARRTFCVVLLQGHHGGLAVPGGAVGPAGVELPLPADRRLLERASEAFAAMTGRPRTGMRTLREARGGEVPGAALDWFYAGAGALALEIAPWGPFVEGGGDVLPRDARFSQEGQRPGDMSARPAPSESDRAWGNWLDDTRGGLGFVDWHPVDLGSGQQALVGGWEPLTQDNPPAESLARALLGIPEFVGGLAAGVPRLELAVLGAERDGDVVNLRAQVKNLGALPTGLAGAAGPQAQGALELVLELPPGARLLAGEGRIPLGRIDGGEISREAAWIVFAPAGSTLVLRTSCELALPVRVEVRP